MCEIVIFLIVPCICMGYTLVTLLDKSINYTINMDNWLVQKQNNHKGIVVMPTIVPSILKLVKNCLAMLVQTQ